MQVSLPEGFRDSGRLIRRVTDRPPVQFQVIGERASATNLVRKLIEKNVRIDRTEALGWKHGAPHMVAIPPDFLVICVVRNAESWALSMHKRPWHAHPDLQRLSFSRFIRAPWHGIIDRPSHFERIPAEIVDRVEGAELQLDRHPITGQRFASLFELRRVKLAAHLGFLNRDCNLLLLRAEQVQTDPEGFVAWFSDIFGLAPRGPEFSGVTRRLGNRFRLAVREREATPEAMTPEDRAFLRAELDLDTEAALGYTYS
ncbi:MAG: hypothetical protein ACLFQL_09440 [Paracoccaceae bacterium]